MSKYIIEIPDDVPFVLLRRAASGKFITKVVPVAELEELNSDYINEHYGELQDEAYQRGLEDGKWKAEDGCDGCKYYEDTSLTNPCSECSRGHVDHYKPLSDPDRIEVGDEVEWAESKCAVIFINRDIETSKIKDYDLLADDGSVAENVSSDRFRKTGKHYDIQSILEAMRE